MTYAEKVGRWRRVFAIDSDGFDLRAIGPDNATAVSPGVRPGAQIYYALSEDYSPFRVVQGPNATPGAAQRARLDPRARLQRGPLEDGAHGDGQRHEPALDRPARPPAADGDAAAREPSGLRADGQGRVRRGDARAARLHRRARPSRRRASWRARRSSATRRRDCSSSTPSASDRARTSSRPTRAAGACGASPSTRARTPTPRAARTGASSRSSRPASARPAVRLRPRRLGRGPLHHAHPAPLAREEDLERSRRVAPVGGSPARAPRSRRYFVAWGVAGTARRRSSAARALRSPGGRRSPRGGSWRAPRRCRSGRAGRTSRRPPR